MKTLKTILMWYSGFALGLTVVVSFFALFAEPEVTCTQGTSLAKLETFVLLFPITAYVVWEIAESLRSQKSK